MKDQSRKNPEDIHQLVFLPEILRSMAEAWIGNCTSAINFRLRRAAAEAQAGAEKVPKLKPIAAELFAAAEALETATSPPRLTRLTELLKLPVSKEFLKAIPKEHSEEWRLLNNEIASTRAHLQMFTAAGWASIKGPNATRMMALRLRGDEQLGEDAALLAVNAARVAESELMMAGFALLGVSRYLGRLVEAIIPFLFICDSSDLCELGNFDSCEAGDMFFPPFEDSPEDVEDVDTALDLLNAAGWLLPGKYLTPGGKKMIKEIAGMLKKLKARVDKKKIDLQGYGVYAVLTYRECVDGMCGNYWEEKTKVVKLDPPQGKGHQLGGKGWKASVIEDLGKNDAATSRQMREFKRLAEADCP